MPGRVNLPGAALLPLQVPKACAWRLLGQVATALGWQQVSLPFHALPETPTRALPYRSAFHAHPRRTRSHATASAQLFGCPIAPGLRSKCSAMAGCSSPPHGAVLCEATC